MRMQSIQSYNLQNKANSKKNYFSSPTINPTMSKDVAKMNFRGGLSGWQAADKAPLSWSARKLRILERSETELKDLAEYFHNYTESQIREIAKEVHWISSSNAKAAAKRLFNAVKDIQSQKPHMSKSELKRLSEKAADKDIFKS